MQLKIRQQINGTGKDGNSIYAADSTGWLTIDISQFSGYKGEAVDGLTEDVKDKKNLISIGDRERDGKAGDYLCIKSFYGAGEGRHLYLGADYYNYNGSSSVEEQYFSFGIEVYGKDKKNFFIQFILIFTLNKNNPQKNQLMPREELKMQIILSPR